MNRMSVKSLMIAIAGAAAFLAVFAAPASATTFCVPAFFEACPDDGTNQVRTSLSAAMSDDGNDGVADRVLIAPGEFVEPGNQQIEADGSDALEVIGAGRDETRIRSTISGNNYVARLNNREGIKVRDLSIAGSPLLVNGAIVQIEAGTLTNVDVEVNNQDGDGIVLVGSNVLSGVHVESGEGFSLDYAVRVNESQPGNSVIIGSSFDRPSYALQAVGEDIKVTVLSSRIDDPSSAGLWVGKGADVKFRNSVITTAGERAVIVQPEAGSSKETLLTIEASTIFNVGTAYQPGLNIEIPNSITAGDARIDVSSSIIFGYEHSWDLSVPIGPGFGGATLNIDHSNFAPTSPETSGGVVNVDDPSNINQDPLFTTPQDLRLQPGSPSIDTGDPSSTLTTDAEGSPRPRDGNGDGMSIPDQGAYEFQPTCATVPVFCPDKTAPKVSKVKFRFRRGKGGAVRLKLSEEATVRVKFAPRPKKKRKPLMITRKAKAGNLTIKLRKNKLKPGRYRMAITATDAAGNKSKPKIRIVRIKR